VSADYASLAAFAVPRKEAAADPYFDEELAEAAVRLLAGGEIKFKLSTRLPAARLPPAKRRVFALLRRLPAWLYVPPALAVQRGTFDYWGMILKECETPDDQILVMMHNRAKSADADDLPVECRPRDETDKKRFLTLQAVFGSYAPEEDLRQLLSDLTGTHRMAKLSL
jgi:hypothetical protein